MNQFIQIYTITKSQGRPQEATRKLPVSLRMPQGSLEGNRSMKKNWLYLF